ncbi:MAG: bifunctional metallophosphatase/5'-nucleotidase [Balneolaceae bacterium]
MSLNRRQFLRTALAGSAGWVLLPQSVAGIGRTSTSPITILYTNDTHARLDPFPNNAVEFAGKGGIARRANLVRSIRDREEHVLLLDAGDVFQGTPWFDLYGGTVDFKLMSEMGYDAMTLGNHEFDRGLDGLAESAQHASFPLLAANYGVHDTPLNDVVQRFIVKEFAGYRIGIFGLGIDLPSWLPPRLYGNVRSRDPYIWANGMVRSLRQSHRCDFVICLSHIGFQYGDDRPSDLKIAAQTEGIDLIIGGHTHTFLDEPIQVLNRAGDTVYVTQMGHGGVRLGRIDLDPESYDRNHILQSTFYTIG